MEAGETMALEAIIRQLVKAQQTEKNLVCSVVNCRMSELAMVL
jgi:hypothetical protein